jgi:hypothetical protein
LRDGKEYLDDAVFVSPNGNDFGIILTTENGISTTNCIFLEPDVMEALISYWKRYRNEPLEDNQGGNCETSSQDN